MQSAPRLIFLVSLVLYVAAMRVLPYGLEAFGVKTDSATTLYPWNFSPLLATSLFAGAFAWRAGRGVWVPLLALLVGDVGIWFFSGRADWVFHSGQFVVYGFFLAAVPCARWLLKANPSLLQGVGAGLLMETVFFVVSNAGCWAAGNGELFEMTASGLAACYIAAIPYFGRSLAGTAVYSALLFSPWARSAAGMSLLPQQSATLQTLPSSIRA